MSRVVDIEEILNKHENYKYFTGNPEYDDGFETGVLHMVEELEDLPVLATNPTEFNKAAILQYLEGAYAAAKLAHDGEMMARLAEAISLWSVMKRVNWRTVSMLL